MDEFRKPQGIHCLNAMLGRFGNVVANLSVRRYTELFWLYSINGRAFFLFFVGVVFRVFCKRKSGSLFLAE